MIDIFSLWALIHEKDFPHSIYRDVVAQIKVCCLTVSMAILSLPLLQSVSLILSVRDIFWTRFLWQLTTKTRKIPAAKHVSQQNKPTETSIVVDQLCQGLNTKAARLEGRSKRFALGCSEANQP